MIQVGDMDIEPESVRLLKRQEFDRLVHLGMFDDERLELLHGMLVRMSPQDALHAAVVRRLNHLLLPLVNDRALVQIQSPLAAGEEHEPEPDVAIVPPGDYLDDHPAQALLVIEVAGSSLRKDRQIKSRIYAAAGVPEYWIVNLVDRLVEVHTEPAGDRYCRITPHGPGETLSPVELPHVRIETSAVLP